LADQRNYDVVIIGAGPAGLTAGLYTARAKLSTVVLEKELVGGQIANVEHVENFPGFPDGVGGYELGQLMQQQAEKFGATIIGAEATGLEIKEDNRKVVKTTQGDFETGVVIIAGAATRKKLGVPGEEEFIGRGVSYCATCDAPLFQDKMVAVVGGGDAAITEALHLAKFAAKVTLIHRRDELRATVLLRDRVLGEPKIDILWDTTVDEVVGETLVKRLKLNNVKTGAKAVLELDGIFVSIGFMPDTGFLKGVVHLDPIGHIITNDKMETDVPGILAAGDIRNSSVRQAITAAGDGATAAVTVEHFLNEQQK
jgi:thioredoxin reductase (NADPH)